MPLFTWITASAESEDLPNRRLALFIVASFFRPVTTRTPARWCTRHTLWAGMCLAFDHDDLR